MLQTPPETDLPKTAPQTDDARWSIALAKDRRFDGMFVTGIHSTGIYCRPSCPARPHRRAYPRLFPAPCQASPSLATTRLACRPPPFLPTFYPPIFYR